MWIWMWLACPRSAPIAPAADPEVAPIDPITRNAWLLDVTAPILAQRIREGTLTSEALTSASLDRIAALNLSGPELRAVVAVYPDALQRARLLDAEVASGRLYGLPVLLKDNIDAPPLPTTAGSLALADHVPGDDAFLTARLRGAGAVLIGKANLSEWANFRSTQSTSGWSGVGGQCRNPHVLDRTPCGSSSGSAVAVASGMVPLAVGTETDGSILCPASINGIVGVKPTLGLVSRDGIVPISHSQDTAGPMARTVTGAAMLLEVLATPDPTDRAVTGRPPDLDTAYIDALDPLALSEARIGIVRGHADFEAGTVALFEAAVADLIEAGAVTVDIERPIPEAVREQEWEVLIHEFRPDLEAYLSTVTKGPRTLPELIAFNQAHASVELRWFGQDLFETALARGPAEEPAYIEALAGSKAALGPGWIDALVAEHDLSALVVPTTGPAWPIDPVLGDRFTGGSTEITAISGYPAITVPMGQVEGLPVGLSFLGPAYSEARLLALAYAYEQATGHRRAPAFVPTVASSSPG